LNMLRILAASAVLGLALGQNTPKIYERTVPEHSDVFGLSQSVLATQEAAELLNTRVSVLEETQKYTATGVQLSAATIKRLDGVIQKVANVKSEIDKNMIALGKTVDSTVSYSDWIEYDMAFRAAAKAATEQSVQNNIELGEREMTNARKINDELAGFEAAVDDAMSDLKSDVDAAVEKAKSSGTFLRSDEHIEQVCGFKPDETNKYWDGKVITSTADHGYVRGRKFYKVMFNAITPGYWSANSDEIHMACAALSIHLRREDGIERDLRPACNHYGHWKSGGLGQCVMVERSYFSHCGGGGYWEQNRACGGVPEVYLRYTIGYEENRHNRDRHLTHNDGSNWHSWRESQVSSAWKYAMCTGGNQNFKV